MTIVFKFPLASHALSENDIAALESLGAHPDTSARSPALSNFLADAMQCEVARRERQNPEFNYPDLESLDDCSLASFITAVLLLANSMDSPNAERFCHLLAGLASYEAARRLCNG